MPLWFPCACRAAKPSYLGQLMRVHIVTPKAPVRVAVMPRVQPSITSPVLFHTGLAAPGALLEPSQYWILRLPYVLCVSSDFKYTCCEFYVISCRFSYATEQGVFGPPKDGNVGGGRFLKGALSVIPDADVGYSAS